MSNGDIPKRTYNALNWIVRSLMPDEEQWGKTGDIIIECEDLAEELAYDIKHLMDEAGLTDSKEFQLVCALIINAYLSAWLVADIVDDYGEADELVAFAITNTCNNYPQFIKKEIEKIRKEKEKKCQKPN